MMQFEGCESAYRRRSPRALGRKARVAVATGLAALLVSGCMSGSTAPGSVRTTAQTAPADLQLLCASSAASSFGVDSSRVLPISSGQLDQQRYQVELDVGGARASCVVDAAGNVISVQKA
jgi:hypothetical protein